MGNTHFKDLQSGQFTNNPNYVPGDTRPDPIAGPTGVAREFNRQTQAALEGELKRLDEQLVWLDYYITPHEKKLPAAQAAIEIQLSIILWPPPHPQIVSYARAVALRKEILARKTQVLKDLDIVKARDQNLARNVQVPPASTTSGTAIVGPLSSRVITNAPMPKVAYFSQLQSLLQDENDKVLYAGNTPNNISDAANQWKTITNGYAAGSKGMIQTWNPPVNFYSAVNAEGTNFESSWSAGSLQRYSFKFLYNPEVVSMSYGGVADFDITTLTSGATKSLPLSPNVFQSTISFTIPLNRIFDMTYLGTAGTFKRGTVASEVYPYTVSAVERSKIYEKGTMYDFEYLLKAILGLELPTQFRGITADVGFLYGRPVELHLGSSLKYLVQISDLGLDHLLFDSRMVPIFSQLRVSAKRIPDYSGDSIRNDTGGGGGSLTVR
jgi:hypothetical protein